MKREGLVVVAVVVVEAVIVFEQQVVELVEQQPLVQELMVLQVPNKKSRIFNYCKIK